MLPLPEDFSSESPDKEPAVLPPSGVSAGQEKPLAKAKNDY
jgi:hypothetical protein